MRALEKETFSLFNPAFVAALIAAAADGYESRAGRPMPLGLAFVVGPLILNGRVRAGLPGNVRARLGGWLVSNTELHAALLDSAPAYAPYVRAGLRAGLRSEALSLVGDALRGRLTNAVPPSDEVGECLRKAGLVGRWFAISGTTADIFRVLGVRP
jgi:hypothetical protein